MYIKRKTIHLILFDKANKKQKSLLKQSISIKEVGGGCERKKICRNSKSVLIKKCMCFPMWTIHITISFKKLT